MQAEICSRPSGLLPGFCCGGNSEARSFKRGGSNSWRITAFQKTNLLVYEHLRIGCLGEALHGKSGGFLGWDLRYKIAIESAKGLLSSP
ncbi:hypothetical protein HHK36_023380 [Tetracentron sinense]|uniref:Uncharacterized protein n=1 Tax=Tetracentron sinense TaxID=13715 RepID=A0A834YQ40_TETSI|nr:hypothetical protein HHK36_023380 [Tetracentron sinense]